jgi:hypothetical protein
MSMGLGGLADVFIDRTWPVGRKRVPIEDIDWAYSINVISELT